MIQVAHDQGLITHKDLRCSAGSVAIAGAVALAARLGKIDVPHFVGQLSEWMRGFDEHFAERVLQLTNWLKLPPKEASPTISLRIGGFCRRLAMDFAVCHSKCALELVQSSANSGRLLGNNLQRHCSRR
jgi:hypothetical protein